MEKKISEIKHEFASAGTEELWGLFALYAEDSRAGVSGLIKQYKKKLEKLEKKKKSLAILLAKCYNEGQTFGKE